jgi:hypothetical protein
MFQEAVFLERGPLSLVSTTEELLGGNSSGFGLEIDNAAVGICCADQAILSVRKKSALTLATSVGHSVGIVRSRIQVTEFC